MLSDVGLIADHFMVVWNTLTADLDAGVDVITDNLELEPELEVRERLPGREKLVLRNPPIESTTNDRAVLDAKRLERTFPTLESLAIKKHNGPGNEVRSPERRDERQHDSNPVVAGYVLHAEHDSGLPENRQWFWLPNSLLETRRTRPGFKPRRGGPGRHKRPDGRSNGREFSSEIFVTVHGIVRTRSLSDGIPRPGSAESCLRKSFPQRQF